MLKEHSSEASQAASAAISAGSTSRPSSIPSSIVVRYSFESLSKSSVLAPPGVIQLTKTPVLATYFDRDFDKLINPALAAAYPELFFIPILPPLEAILTTLPYFLEIIDGTII